MRMTPVEIGLLLVIALLFAFIGIGMPLEARLQRFCLSKGYPSADWRMLGPNYCIRRVDQTDQVVSVDSLRAHP